MDGFININKASGPSSHWVVARLKRLLQEKAGHCGTLDPMAQGVLPVCLGKATRLAEYVVGRGKQYLARVRFGISTDSYDAEGKVLASADPSAVTKDQLESLLPAFRGEILQAPPAVSALKQGGEALYKKVLRGEEVQVEARPVHIYGLELLDFVPGPEAYAKLLVDCGQGAYIRSLAHDLGEALGCGAHLDFLQRTRVGDFLLEESYSLEQIEEMLEQGDTSFLISMNDTLSHLPAWTCREEDISGLSHGNALPCPGTSLPLEQPLRVLDPKGQLLGIGKFSAEGLLNMDKVLVGAIDPPEQKSYAVCAIGNFDGLHLGHRALLRHALWRKRRLGGKSALVTFSPHPLTLITGKAPSFLLSERLKKQLAKEELGMDAVVTLPFTEELMHRSPEEFVDQIILGQLHARELVVGFNFTFGAGGKGTAETLRSLCEGRGLGVSIIEKVEGDYGTVSSSNIRRHLQEGELDAVREMLSYWFTLDGIVKGGGFPLDPAQALPPEGWYAVRLRLKKQVFPGLALLEAGRLCIPQQEGLPELQGRRVLVHFGAYLGKKIELSQKEAEKRAKLQLVALPEGEEWR
ncbi:MAG: tRNA pseudouridine(55) synthase TruB [Bacillota bacterium]|nr:tRNA pseudouridine(55) synthase TruB [Bacillota bacterium]